MRTRVLPSVGLSVSAAVLLAMTLAPVANASSSPAPVAMARTSASYGTGFQPAKLGSCYSQLDADNGVSIVSQNFEPMFDAFDTRGADDFVLQRACLVNKIDVAGAYLNGSGPAVSENITIYHNLRGLPGKVVSNQTRLVGVDDGTGNIQIPLKTAVSLQANVTYVVSVQVNMDFSTGGEWGWSTNSTKVGSPASWRNNFDGFGTGCVHFTRLLTCIPGTEGADFAFGLDGSARS